MNDTTVASGVEGGAALAAFVDAVLADERAAIEPTRDRVIAELGPPAAVDAAAVMAMFTVMNRIADATGTPLDQGPAEAIMREVGDRLGMTEHR